MKKKLTIVLVLVAIVAGAAGTLAYKWLKVGDKPSPTQGRSYALELLSPTSVPAKTAANLMFDIRDTKNNVVKEFNKTQSETLHLYVIRKDRVVFQHLHPVFNANTGAFSQDGVKYLADGEYRLFADFTPKISKPDKYGVIKPTQTYADIKAGDQSKYDPTKLLTERLDDTDGDYSASFFFASDNDSANSIPDKSFYAGVNSSFAISIDKNANPYTNLETKDGSLGQITAIGPDLKLISVPADPPALKDQVGLLTFSLVFPVTGKYKLYLETQSEGQPHVFLFVLDVKKNYIPNNQQ
jgi:hypothetical protein